jgi:hypothetical protein
VISTSSIVGERRRDEDRGEERAQEIKRRIDEMRSKLNRS